MTKKAQLACARNYCTKPLKIFPTGNGSIWSGMIGQFTGVQRSNLPLVNNFGPAEKIIPIETRTASIV
jgi:hypothetical protein